MTNVDAYIRVSQVRGRGGESFISPQQQRERIEAWAKMQGHRVVQVHEELDESGARADRPKLELALKRIERGETGGLVVARLDRFGRSLVDALEAIGRIRAAGGTFASVADGFDLATETGRLVLRIMLSLAEFELDRIRGNFSDARARAVARGIHPCPVPPVGYTRPEDEDGKVIGPLEPNDAAPVVTELFVRRAAGESLVALSKLLVEKGVRGAYGNEGWTTRAVKTMLRNRVYLGEAHHGEFVNPDAHEALTDELTFRRAGRPGRLAPGRGTNPQLLAGILRCAGCRYAMKSYGARGARQFACHAHHPSGDCPEPAYISTSTGLEQWVEERFFEAVGHLELEPVADTREVEAADRRVQEADAALKVFRDDPRIVEALGADSFAEGLSQRRQELDEAYAARAAVEDRSGLPNGFGSIELRETWPELSIPERRQMLSTIIDGVFVRRGRSRHAPIDDFLHVCFRGEGPNEVPRRGARSGYDIQPFVFPNGTPARSRVTAGK